MRKFFRHPVDVPIEVRLSEPGRRTQAPDLRRVLDVSLGGIAFDFFHALESGAIVALRIPAVRPAFESAARVVWCRPYGNGYRVGAEFLDAHDDFRIRMVEQVCQIESYRRQIRASEQRELSPDEAAREWIEKFAAHYPQTGTDELQ